MLPNMFHSQLPFNINTYFNKLKTQAPFSLAKYLTRDGTDE